MYAIRWLQFHPERPRDSLRNYLSSDIHARESHLKEIELCIRPILNGRKPFNVWLSGSPVVGKSATARWTLRKLKSEAVFVQGHLIFKMKGIMGYKII